MKFTKVADAIRRGDIKINVLGDELFERYLGTDKYVLSNK